MDKIHLEQLSSVKRSYFPDKRVKNKTLSVKRGILPDKLHLGRHLSVKRGVPPDKLLFLFHQFRCIEVTG